MSDTVNEGLLDLGICPDCALELADPNSRHYRYPFIHCNHCGPRYAILEGIPFQRSNTSLKNFPPCPDCIEEQQDPHSRRFGLETISCPACGPQFWLETVSKGEKKISARGEAALAIAHNLLAQGRLLYLRGSRASYLLCQAFDPQAISALRNCLGGSDQPLSLLFPDLQALEEHCLLDGSSAALLESAPRPLLLLEKRVESPLGKQISPYLKTMPARLPVDGLERLLFQESKRKRFSLAGQVAPPRALVCTGYSSLTELNGQNQHDNRLSLEGAVAGSLVHQLDVYPPPGDTTLRLCPEQGEGSETTSSTQRQRYYPLNLGGGYTPLHIQLPAASNPILAYGSDRENTLCFAQGQSAWLYPGNGDLNGAPPSLENYAKSLASLEKLQGGKAEILAHDLDENQLSTRLAQERGRREGLVCVPVQQHQALLAACRVDNQLPPGMPAIGVTFDLGGAGTDRQKGKPVIWGGEFFIITEHGFQRAYHLSYQPLPGGAGASRNLARRALAYLWEAGVEWELDIPSVSAVCAQETSLLRSMLKHRLNTPNHSSMGILFEAVASLVGLRQETSYPAQALWEIEAALDPDELAAYSFEIMERQDSPGQINPLPLVREVVEDLRTRVKSGRILARFQNGVVALVFQVCSELRHQRGISSVLLSGEIWQNHLLLQTTIRKLREGGFQVYTHQRTPPNASSLSLGQAIIAG